MGVNDKTFEATCLPQGGSDVSHNLLGQRLGRKGQKTRDRIISAALRLIETSPESQVTLSAVAREVPIGLATLYLYFPDFVDLLLACLNRVMDSADVAFVDRMRTRWPDDTLHQSCLDLVQAHYRFWRDHARILHMRNSCADAGDPRVFEYRRRVSRPLIEAFVLQMDGLPGEDTYCHHLATVVLAGFERLATVITNSIFRIAIKGRGAKDEATYIQELLNVEADLIYWAIHHQREASIGYRPHNPQAAARTAVSL